MQQSINISSLPNFSGSTEHSGVSEPDVIQNLTMKCKCRRDKMGRSFLLPEVDVGDIQMIEDIILPGLHLIHL